MRRARWLLAAVLLLLVTWVTARLLARAGAARGSALSRGGDGWLAARRYLEARGARVELLTAPLPSGAEAGTAEAPGVLAIAFPWQQAERSDFDARLDLYLRRGGDVVLAYSGEESDLALAGLLDLRWRRARTPPLDPWSWRAFARREWDLRPAGFPAPPVRVWAPRVLPEPPPGSESLFVSPRGSPVVAAFRRWRGRVVLLPMDALTNARLGEPGNADLLETLLVRLGPRWTFDEYHHGLVAAAAADRAHLGPAVDVLLAHLGLLYLLAAFALMRRQGPAWNDPPPAAGSAGSFLLGLGTLHDRLGHHAEAAWRLLTRARALDRGLVVPAELERRAAAAGRDDLLAIARELAQLRRIRR